LYQRLDTNTAAATTAAIAAVLLLFTLFPAPDRPGGEIKAFGTAEAVDLRTTLAALGTAFLLTALAVRAVVRTPQRGADEAQRVADEQWRRDTVRVLAAACATLFAAVFTACMFWYAGAQLDWRGAGGSMLQSQTLGYLLTLAGGGGLVLLIRFGAVPAGLHPHEAAMPDARHEATSPSTRSSEAATRIRPGGLPAPETAGEIRSAGPQVAEAAGEIRWAGGAA
jgi:hypothetical protein